MRLPLTALWLATPALWCVLCADLAHAQSDDVVAEASNRVNHGLELYAAGDLAGARKEFAAAQLLVPDKPNPYRLLALVDAHMGQCTDALREVEVFLKLAAPDDRRRPEALSVREQCQRELAPKTGSLVVTTTPDGAEVRLDSESAET